MSCELTPEAIRVLRMQVGFLAQSGYSIEEMVSEVGVAYGTIMDHAADVARAVRAGQEPPLSRNRPVIIAHGSVAAGSHGGATYTSGCANRYESVKRARRGWQ